MTAERVTSIFVTYNSGRTIDAALQAAREAHDAGILRSIVVDNASSDDTVDRVKRCHPWAEIVEAGRNLGYGRGLNVGLRTVESPYVLFMNPDAVLRRRDLEVLIRTLEENPQVGMVGPAIVEDGGGIQVAGGLPTPGSILRGAISERWRNPRQRPVTPGGEPFATDWLCGAVLCLRTELARRLGGFDPRYFLYFEETDLCRRILDAGLQLWAVGQAVATHAAGESTRGKGATAHGCLAEHYYRSRFYYLTKHHGLILGAMAELGEAVLLVLAALPRRLCGKKNSRLAARWKGPFLRLPEKWLEP